jgi:hypothetical protein
MNTNDVSGFNIYLTKTKQHTEMKLAPWEGKLQKLFVVACGRSPLQQ